MEVNSATQNGWRATLFVRYNSDLLGEEDPKRRIKKDIIVS